jgi:hypothetical protein
MDKTLPLPVITAFGEYSKFLDKYNNEVDLFQSNEKNINYYWAQTLTYMRKFLNACKNANIDHEQTLADLRKQFPIG